jgi:hypothetical protein
VAGKDNGNFPTVGDRNNGYSLSAKETEKEDSYSRLAEEEKAQRAESETALEEVVSKRDVFQNDSQPFTAVGYTCIDTGVTLRIGKPSLESTVVSQ